MTYYPQQPPPGDWAPRPVKKPSKWMWILGGIAAVLALCLGGTIAIGLVAGDSGSSERGNLAASVAAAETSPTVTTEPATPSAAPSATPSPTPTATPKPTATAKATTKATKKATTKATTKPEPTTAITHAGVTPGAFCSEHGDFGLTSKGTLMKCKTSATDTRYRWRKA
jgi:predicted lipid-binding transport protein (Tim44 family)